MKVFAYNSWKDYRESQIQVNKKKLERFGNHYHQAAMVTLQHLVEYLRKTVWWSEIDLGLCHGARNGWEVKCLQGLLPGVVVVGTDISPTAWNYPGMVQMDFHYRKPEWDGRFDFIYCNSLDHARDPVQAVGTWLKHLKSTGMLFVEWTKFHDGSANDPNCFAGTREEYRVLMAECGVVRDELEVTVLNSRSNPEDDSNCSMPYNQPYEVVLFVVGRKG